MSIAPRILIAEDEAHNRAILKEFLTSRGYAVAEAENGEKALEAIKAEGSDIQIVLTDLTMPVMDGIELIQKAKALKGELEFIVMTAHGSVDTAIRAMKAGASDYLLKPLELEDVAHRLKRQLEMRALAEKAERLEEENRKLRPSARPVGESSSMQKLLDEVSRVARTDATVLISGETGTGKEVVARAIHNQSQRAKGPFIAVNCSAIPENLLESEFFGYEKGAFTGADRRTLGLFERASGGTLFLDEIGEMDLKLQPKILRALEERKIKRVGGGADVSIDVRLVAATHRDLGTLVSDGRFREDLYYRLNVVKLHLLPLRDRVEDIAPLVRYLVERSTKNLNVKVESIEPGFIDALKNYRFPGNVRELGNIVERAMIYMSGKKLDQSCLPSEVTGLARPVQDGAAAVPAAGSGPAYAPGKTLADMMNQCERQILEAALAGMSHDVEKVAQALDVAKSTLYTKLSKHGIR